MPVLSQKAIQNRLLKALPVASFERLRPHLEQVDLPLMEVLVPPGAETTHVHFLESGLGSMVASGLGDDEHIEVGHIGWEGISGAHLVLGSRQSPNRTFMQIAGTSFRMEASAFLQALEDDRLVQQLLLRYIHSYEIQLSHSALANGRYHIRERLARWLLMCHDRHAGDDLPLTHEFLSLMLGVRRSGVTDQIHVLEGLGLIKARRGLVRIRDRAHLEEFAGGCYGLPEREYKRLIQETH
jgi:CRP-like cAMP-binding protein